MKAQHILVCLALSLLGAGLKAQNELPQVFSPNAAELGKYGKTPVSYFNGLPNISIPLTELKAKGYTLPIYLTYHASGNKPDQHPGWVGLGWTLHAGGCINRIVNGLKDEMTTEEYYGIHRDDEIIYSPPGDPGYYYHATAVQETNWDDVQNWYDVNHELVMMDRDPDEFQICLDDIQASFYFTSGGAIRIVSKSDADFTVEAHMTPGTPDPVIIYPGPGQTAGRGQATRYKFFDRFTVTSKDGTRYVFGGDDSAIEYWMPLTPVLYVDQGSGTLRNANQWRCIATACTWMLTRIERPDGETILFTYEKDGTPVVRRDVHQGGYELASRNGQTLRYYSYDTKDNPTYKTNISFSLIQPSYLSLITCQKSLDSLVFARTRTTELKYPTTEPEFETRAGIYYYDDVLSGQRYYSYEHIMSEDYYMQMSGITGPSRDIHLSYTSNSNRRLSLQQVSFHNSRTTLSDYCYSFEYNSEPLPPYGARKNDVWGFYNDIYYGNVSSKQMESVRSQVNPSKAQAEILTAVNYPTGGRTEFTYEGHTYSKRLEPIELNLEEIGASVLTGGLRIREVKDYSVANRPEIRTFSYMENAGLSSGILAGSPRLYVQGHTLLYFQFGNPKYYHGPDTLAFTSHYHLYSENPLRPLSTTDGNYVTYSQVRETYADGSYTDYRYSNHDQILCIDTLPEQRYEIADSLLLVTSFNSRELFRGMLLERKDYDKDAHLVRQEQNDYDRDTTSFLKAISCERASDFIKSSAYRKILTGYPFLKRKKVTFFHDTGTVPYSETQEYTYDSHRRLTEVKRNVAGTKERDAYTYTGNYSGAPYSGMISRNMIAYPVENIRFRKDTLKSEVVIGAELNTWKLHGDHYVPSEQWKAAISPGVSPASFNAYDVSSKDSRYGSTPELTFTQYDGNANPILSEDRSGLPTTYAWTKDGCHPAAIFTGSRNGFRTEAVETETNGSVWRDLNLLSSGSSIDLEFTCERSGLVEVFLDFVKAYGRTVWWRMDFGTEHQWVWPSPGPEEELEIQTLFSGNLPAGGHIFQVTAVQGNFTEMAEEEPEEDPDSGTGHGPWASMTYVRFPELAMQNPVSWGSVNVSFPSTEEQMVEVRADDCLFDDFEDNASSTHEGFHGGKSYNGVKTLAFNPYPDRYYVIDWQERQSDGSWRYRSKTVDGQGPFTAGNPGKTIDHVRVFPVGTTAESYTWDPAGNLTSRTDSRGVTESYSYDSLGRLTGVYDNDGNKVEGYQYNYKNR